MHLVIASPFYPPFSPGGAEHSLEQLCWRLRERNVSIDVITPSFDGQQHTERINKHLVINRFSTDIVIDPGQEGDAEHFFQTRKYCEQTINIMRQVVKFNSILLANNAQSILTVARGARIFSRPSIGIVRDAQFFCMPGFCIQSQKPERAVICRGFCGQFFCYLKTLQQGSKVNLRAYPGIAAKCFLLERRRKRLLQHGLRSVDKVVVISEALKKIFLSNNLLTTNTISVIHNFHTSVVEAENALVNKFIENNFLSPNRYFLVAGKKSYGKGSDIVLKAVNKVNKKIKNTPVKVLLVGKGGGQFSSSFSVDHESVSQPLLMGLLRRSVGLIVPGRCQEGLHRTMVDAVFYKKPVICTDPGGVSTGVVDGVTGYVIPSDNVNLLADAMCRVLSWDNRQNNKCVAVSMDIFEQKFSDSVIVYNWLSLLESL